jgi:hypothetical protein
MSVSMPLLRRLVAGFSQRRPGFASGSISVGFVVDKAALGQDSLRFRFRFPLSVSFHHCPVFSNMSSGGRDTNDAYRPSCTET